MTDKGIRITVEDLETGDTATVEIWDTYFLLCAGSCHVSHQQVSQGGRSVQLSIKGIVTGTEKAVTHD